MSNYSTPEAKWQATRTRDPLSATEFVYCVKTTRIFCRPTCSARLARRSNVEFFDNSLEAKKAGYRACKRCRPELETFEPAAEVAASACEIIRNKIAKGEKISLDELAKSNGLTKWHFHRMFKKSTGFTPKEWADRARKDQFEASKQQSLVPSPELDSNSAMQEVESSNVMAIDDFYDPSLALDQPESLGMPDEWEGRLFGVYIQDSETPSSPTPIFPGSLTLPSTTPVGEFGTPFDASYDTETTLSTHSISTPVSFAEPMQARTRKVNPDSPGEHPLYFTIRDTNYGVILIGYRNGEIVTLKMGITEDEVMSELQKEYTGFISDSSLTELDYQSAETGVTGAKFETYVDNILEALERPTGKTVQAPLNLSELVLLQSGSIMQYAKT